MRLAEEEAAAVFRRAGIDAEWKNCPSEEIFAQTGEPCGQVEYPSKLVLRIVERPRGLPLPGGRRTPQTATAASPEGD